MIGAKKKNRSTLISFMILVLHKGEQMYRGGGVRPVT